MIQSPFDVLHAGLVKIDPWALISNPNRCLNADSSSVSQLNDNLNDFARMRQACNAACGTEGVMARIRSQMLFLNVQYRGIHF